MILQEERELIVLYGKKLVTSQLTKGTGGNISIYNRDKKLMAISPSGMDYFKIEPEDVVVMDLNGNVIDGTQKPSVEFSMHSIFYRNREEINAVVHTHSIACSTMAALHENLPAVNYLVALGGSFSIPCAKYATFGTDELAESALKGMGSGYACFLENHGFLSAAPSISSAFNIAEEIEFCSEIYLRAKAVGTPTIISDEKLNELFMIAQKYNQGN